MERQAKLELAINVPTTVVLVKNKPFKTGENEYGMWYGYNLQVNGETFTFFAKEAEHQQFQCFDPGTTLVITRKETAKDGKKFRTTDIKQAIFDDHGNEPPAGKPTIDLIGDKEARNAFRQDRITNMHECLRDAAEVVALYNMDANLKLGSEDIRAIGISFAIEFERRTR